MEQKYCRYYAEQMHHVDVVAAVGAERGWVSALELLLLQESSVADDSVLEVAGSVAKVADRECSCSCSESCC